MLPMPCSLVIFDLDGTRADSLPWFRRNVNDVADRFGNLVASITVTKRGSGVATPAEVLAAADE